MNLLKPGKITSEVEVTDISAHGIWLLADDREHFLSHDMFPWFKQGSVAAVLNVVREADQHFHWPDIDVDLSLESIRNPEKFPLKWQPQ